MKASVALFTCAVSASVAAYAAEEWPSFRKADNDNNGAITMEEARTVPELGENFAEYDQNKDGRLSRSEYESAKKSVRKADSGSQEKR